MARDRANIKTGIWTDDHWRTLSRDQQWLYNLILTHPELSYAGVADWRPGRLLQFAANTSKQDIERLGAELQSERFIFIDDNTEEVLVRSFTRHDGLLKQPKLTVSMVNAYAAIASNNIREVFVYELRRLHDEYPDLKAFENRRVLDLLKLPARSMDDFTLGLTPQLTLDVTPAFTPNAAQALPLPTSTATTTSISKEIDSPAAAQGQIAGVTGTRIPYDFKATNKMIAWALDNAPTVDSKTATQKFKLYYQSAAGKNQFRTDWQAAWELWMLNEHTRNAPPKPPNATPSPWDRKGVHE